MNDFIISNIKKLKQKKIPNPEIDLRILLNYSKYKKYKNKNILLSNFVLDQINIKKFNLLLNRRLSKEPISKIINKKSFWKDDFFVNHFVLDPRPETEAIIDESLNIIKNKKAYLRILDIGTGSGAIAISLAREFVNAKIYAIDISIEAIKVAKINIIEKNLQNQIKLKHGSLDSIKEKFDLIVSNPPYLSKNEITKTGIEIKNFEPKIALDGGEDGLDFYKEFAKKIPKIMNKNSHMILEIGENQLKNCKQIFRYSSLNLLKKTQDLQKKDRIMVLSKL